MGGSWLDLDFTLIESNLAVITAITAFMAAMVAGIGLARLLYNMANIPWQSPR